MHPLSDFVFIYVLHRRASMANEDLHDLEATYLNSKGVARLLDSVHDQKACSRKEYSNRAIGEENFDIVLLPGRNYDHLLKLFHRHFQKFALGPLPFLCVRPSSGRLLPSKEYDDHV